MSIQQTLFAVSTTPAKHALLGTPQAVLAYLSSQGTLTPVNVQVRAHWYDPDLARQWLAEARSEKFSEATINALAPAEQNARVVELWKAVGNFWQAMNLSPYSLARFRRMCERLWGYPAYDDAADSGWFGKINTPFMNGRWGGEWRARAKAAIYNPATTPDQFGRFSPAYGGNRGDFYTSEGNQEFGWTDIVFGTPPPYAIENAGGRPGQSNKLADSAFAPTVEVHRIWSQRNGAIIGGYPRGFDVAYASQPDVNLAAAWRDFNFSEPSAAPPSWDDWRCGFVLPDVATMGTTWSERHGAREGSTDVLWTTVPLRWYWEMLRAPQLLVRGNYAGEALAPVTMSLVDYLWSQTPDALAREVMLDAASRNDAMIRKHSLTPDQLSTAAMRDEMRRVSEAQQGAEAVNGIIRGGFTAVGAVVGSVFGATPAGAAIGGAVGSAVALVNNIFDKSTGPEGRRVDVFGRLMPALDTVGIVDTEGGAQDMITHIGTPSGGGISLYVGLVGVAASNNGPLTIANMPHGGTVEIGVDRDEPTCRWVDDTLTQWRCTIPTGPQWVRVIAPTGEVRLARTETSNIAPATIAWDSMFAEHRYVITGLPPGTAVFVDGAPAVGTWDSPAQTAWHVFVPQGSRAIRLVPPTGAVALVTVMAQGAQSGATWASLQTLSVQQSVVATEGTSWLPWVVGGGAVALLIGTLMLGDGKRQKNPSRRK